ncbi:hypothetical protein NHH88_15715 [Oxalobacteraceae bacterium OTU3CAMAD1]|nr:hypothetical protein NHH88_15715 [Oxalobacteraceae bacterium OTU3CAMAD1]
MTLTLRSILLAAFALCLSASSTSAPVVAPGMGHDLRDGAAGNRRVDYLPRGVTEVLAEARSHPELAVEQHLLLAYQADFRFYLGATERF